VQMFSLQCNPSVPTFTPLFFISNQEVYKKPKAPHVQRKFTSLRHLAIKKVRCPYLHTFDLIAKLTLDSLDQVRQIPFKVTTAFMTSRRPRPISQINLFKRVLTSDLKIRRSSFCTFGPLNRT